MKLLLVSGLAACCSCAAALASDQTDPTFGQGGVALVPQPRNAASAGAGIWGLDGAAEGKFVAALGGVGRYAYFGAAQFNQDGSLDQSFGSQGFTPQFEIPRSATATEYVTQAQGIAAQGDGKIVVAGLVQSIFLNRSRFLQHLPLLVRYQTDGSLDPSFGEGGFAAPGRSSFKREVFRDVAIAPDGRIVAVGSGDESDREGSGVIIAYTANGAVDSGFGKNGRVSIHARRVNPEGTPNLLSDVEVLPSGKVIVAGYLGRRLLLARLLANGEFDSTFGGGDGKVAIGIPGRSNYPEEWSASLAVQPDGRILVEGEMRTIDDNQLRIRDYPTLARFRPSGKLDRSFSRDGLVSPKAVRNLDRRRDIVLQPDGRIVVLGYEGGIRRYLPNGTLDDSFGSRGSQAIAGNVYAALTQPDGRIVAGGYLRRAVGDGFETDLLLTRYLAG